jgi:hypothetical protein
MTRIALLIWVAALGGCYAPDLRDCTVTCTGADDCAGDQVCNDKGLCAADGVTCMGGSNGGTVDAAVPTVTLRVTVDGEGKVVVDGIGDCSRDCTWQVPQSAARRLEALPTGETQFDKWTTSNCSQPMNPRCTITPGSSTTVGAKFR